MAIKTSSFKYVPAYQGDEGLVLNFQEKASSTFITDDLVVLTSGQIDICGADPTKILGVAKKDKTGTTNSLIPVQVIRQGDVFLANFVSSKTFAVTDVGVSYEIVKTAAGNWQVDSTTSANNLRVTVLGSAEYTSDGKLNASAGGPVYVTFLNTAGTSTFILQGMFGSTT